MSNQQNLSVSFILFSLFAAFSSLCFGLSDERKVYIVYMGALPRTTLAESTIQSQQLSILQNVVKGSSVRDRLAQSYKRSFNGFAALLTEEEQCQLSRMEGVVSVFPSREYKLHTTRSWDFIGFTKKAKREQLIESDIIIGVLDTGIWPESESFSDEGLSPPPKKWKGICQTNGNITCNNKLIGARFYEGDNARDFTGHGTHTASIAAGREVSGVSLYGLAQGTARGAVPSTRIAIYKVCNNKNVCPDFSILAGFDDAIADGVDIISISIGPITPSNYSSDSVSIGSFHAMIKGILTSQSAGNNGPNVGTISSVAPWTVTVAASTTDRMIVTKAITRDGKVFQCRTINSFPSTNLVPLILPTNASNGCSIGDARACLPNCLDMQLIKGKIVFCEKPSIGDALILAGAVGQITEVKEELLGYLSSMSYALPFTVVDLIDGGKIKSYLSNTKAPEAEIYKSEAINDSSAPVAAFFSSRGPNLISSNILKPDITAPGVEILAAFSPAASLSFIKQDKRSVKYHILSGTSMACPHVSGAAAYVKSFHPNWSPAAIKSALMTTAFPMNADKNPDVEFSFGSGQVDPVKAVQPGLVYDAQKDDYIWFLCNEGYSTSEISLISGENVDCSRVSTGSSRDLNYPTMQLLVAANKAFSSNFSRSVTNVGSPVSTYNVTVMNQHRQLQIAVNPTTLSFKGLNEKLSFIVTITGRGLWMNSIISSSMVWSDGVHSVRSPIVVFTSNKTQT